MFDSDREALWIPGVRWGHPLPLEGRLNLLGSGDSVRICCHLSQGKAHPYRCPDEVLVIHRLKTRQTPK